VEHAVDFEKYTPDAIACRDIAFVTFYGLTGELS